MSRRTDLFVALDGAAAATPRQIALVPGAAAPLVQLDLPPGVTGAARVRVARRQLQDRMGYDAGAVDMRPLERGKGWTRAVVTDPAGARDWCARAGRARHVLPDYLSLPTAPGVWTVQSMGAGLAVRLGPDDGFTAGTAMALAQLAAALKDVRPDAVVVIGPAPEGLADLLEDHGVPRRTGADGLEVLSHGELSCDLRRDPMALRVRVARGTRAVLGAAALVLVAAGLWAWSDYEQARRAAEARTDYAAATEAILRGGLIPSGPILDIRAQVSRALAAAATPEEATSDALSLLAQAAPVIAASGGALDRIASAEGRDLDLVVRVPDFATAGALRDALDAGEEITADMIEASVTGAGEAVRAEIRLTGQTAP